MKSILRIVAEAFQFRTILTGGVCVCVTIEIAHSTEAYVAIKYLYTIRWATNSARGVRQRVRREEKEPGYDKIEPPTVG